MLEHSYERNPGLAVALLRWCRAEAVKAWFVAFDFSANLLDTEVASVLRIFLASLDETAVPYVLSIRRSSIQGRWMCDALLAGELDPIALRRSLVEASGDPHQQLMVRHLRNADATARYLAKDALMVWVSRNLRASLATFAAN